MKAYFWMKKPNGETFNWEAENYYVYRGTKQISILGDSFLETGVADEIVLLVPKHQNVLRDLGYRTWFMVSDPRNVEIFPEAFLTITKKNQRLDKYRLGDVCFMGCLPVGPETETEPYYLYPMKASTVDWAILISFEKIKSAHHAPSSPTR